MNKKMVAKLMQLKVEMKEISEEQSSIKEGQRQVKEKFETIESECENLRQETMMIMQQSACTRHRLALMFQILKARESNDLAKAAELTLALRLVSFTVVFILSIFSLDQHNLKPLMALKMFIAGIGILVVL